VKLELGHRRDKAANVVVDARLEMRSRKAVDRRLNYARRHIARTEDSTEDMSEIYNVANYKADFLRAKERVEAPLRKKWMKGTARSPIPVMIVKPRRSRLRSIGSLNIRFDLQRRMLCSPQCGTGRPT
jgi:hypothetical protein